jgi:hypothetical protein
MIAALWLKNMEAIIAITQALAIAITAMNRCMARIESGKACATKPRR